MTYRCKLCGLEWPTLPESFIELPCQRITGRNGSRLYQAGAIIHDISEWTPKPVVGFIRKVEDANTQ